MSTVQKVLKVMPPGAKPPIRRIPPPIRRGEPLPPPVQSKPAIPLPEERLPDDKLLRGTPLEEPPPPGGPQKTPRTWKEKAGKAAVAASILLPYLYTGYEIYKDWKRKPPFPEEGFTPETWSNLKTTLEEVISEPSPPKPPPVSQKPTAVQAIEQSTDEAIKEMQSYIKEAYKRITGDTDEPKPPLDKGAMYRMPSRALPMTVEDTVLAALMSGVPHEDIT